MESTTALESAQSIPLRRSTTTPASRKSGSLENPYLEQTLTSRGPVVENSGGSDQDRVTKISVGRPRPTPPPPPARHPERGYTVPAPTPRTDQARVKYNFSRPLPRISPFLPPSHPTNYEPPQQSSGPLPAFRIVGHPQFGDSPMPKPEHEFYHEAPHLFGPRSPVPHPHTRMYDSDSFYRFDAGSGSGGSRTASEGEGVRVEDEEDEEDEERLWEDSEDLYRVIQGQLLSEEDSGQELEDDEGMGAASVHPLLQVRLQAQDLASSPHLNSKVAPMASGAQRSAQGYGALDNDYETLFYKKLPPFPQASGSVGAVPTIQQGPHDGGLAVPRTHLEEKPSTETFFTVPSSGSENRDSLHYPNPWDAEGEEKEKESQHAEEDATRRVPFTQPIPLPSMPEPASTNAHYLRTPRPPPFPHASQSTVGYIPEVSPSMPKPQHHLHLPLPEPEHQVSRPHAEVSKPGYTPTNAVPSQFPTPIPTPTRPSYGQAQHAQSSHVPPQSPLSSSSKQSLGSRRYQGHLPGPAQGRPSDYDIGKPDKVDGGANGHAKLDNAPNSASASLKPPISESQTPSKLSSSSASTKPQQKQDDKPQTAAEASSSTTQPKHIGTRYVNMLLALDDIPNYWNLLASFFTWILLAGFLLFPGTFTSWQQQSAEAAAGGGVAVTDAVKKAILGAVTHVPLFVIAFLCSGLGAAGMGWLWWRWRANYVWLLNKVFVPGLLNALAGLLSTLANIFGAQSGQLSATAKVTVIVTSATCGVTGILVGVYQFWLLRRVQNEHFMEIGGKVAKGRHGEGVLKGMVESRRKVKEGA